MVDKSCIDRVLEIQEYLDRKLDYDKKGMPYINPELQEHLAGCARCRRELADQQELLRRLADFEDLEPPADLILRVMENLTQAPVNRLPSWSLGVGTFFLGLAALMFYLLVYSASAVFGRLNVLKSVAEKAIIGMVKVFLSIIDLVTDLNSILISVLKALESLVGAYPAAFGAITLSAILLMMVLIREVGLTQKKLVECEK